MPLAILTLGEPIRFRSKQRQTGKPNLTLPDQSSPRPRAYSASGSDSTPQGLGIREHSSGQSGWVKFGLGRFY